ncbi:PepSY-like domain-containing protein [Bacteroidota bacterium]
MRRTIFLTLLAVIAICTYAQDIEQKNVPAVLVNAFQLKFANTEDVDWELKEGVYLVDFELNDKDNTVWMDDKGNILKHKQELWESEVPGYVIATIRSKCEFFDLNDAERTEEGDKVVYYINFERGSKDCDFWLDGKGNLIKFKQELKKSEIPETILTSIRNQYGSFDIDDAEKTEAGGKVIIKLDGEINDKDHSFWFDAKVSMLKHTQDLRNSEIPVPVMKSISSLYTGYEIRDADKIEEGGKTTYDLELRKSKEKIHVIFDQKGEVLEVISN